MKLGEDFMLEWKDEYGYDWIQDLRYDDYYYLRDFEHLIVTKAVNSNGKEVWEAIVFQDGTCSTVVGKQEFATIGEAQRCLEEVMEKALKNRD